MSIVDASLLGAAENPDEPNHQAAAAFLRESAASGRLLAAPTIVLPEFASALRRTRVTPDMVSLVLSRFVASASVRLLPVTSSIASRAAELVSSLGLRGCDAVYVALAESLGDELVTLDQEQLRLASSVISARSP